MPWTLLPMQIALASLSGLSIGFELGLVGGGAGMLAVPLLLYIVKVGDPHVAIGTTAVTIALTALVNLVSYSREGLVRWRVASIFAAAGAAGAFAGSKLSLGIDGRMLMMPLAAMVTVVAVLMLTRAQASPVVNAALVLPPTRRFATAGAGVAVGGVAGLFGISGGFLSVPALHIITRISMLEAVASSLLLAVVSGTTTAANYAIAGKVSVPLAIALVGGGIVGGHFGMRAAKVLAHRKETLRRVFAGVLLVIAAYIAYRSATQT